MNLLKASKFDFLGQKVEERIFEISPTSCKIVWTLYPFEETSLAGMTNPCVHKDYISSGGTDKLAEEMARKIVREKFKEVHSSILEHDDEENFGDHAQGCNG